MLHWISRLPAFIFIGAGVGLLLLAIKVVRVGHEIMDHNGVFGIPWYERTLALIDASVRLELLALGALVFAAVGLSLVGYGLWTSAHPVRPGKDRPR